MTGTESKAFVCAGSECLRFEPDDMRRAACADWADAWIARWDHSPHWTRTYYTVCPNEDDYDVHRPDHPLGEFHGRYSTREYAMLACVEDFEKVARLQRWAEYMSNNEPPGKV